MERALASWEAAPLSLRARLRRYPRALLSRLWGPVGALMVHGLVICVLVSATVPEPAEPEWVSPTVMLTAEPIPLLEPAPPPVTLAAATLPMPREDVAREVEEALATKPLPGPVGGSGTKDAGTGLGTGNPSQREKGMEVAPSPGPLPLAGLRATRTAGGCVGNLGAAQGMEKSCEVTHQNSAGDRFSYDCYRAGDLLILSNRGPTAFVIQGVTLLPGQVAVVGTWLGGIAAGRNLPTEHYPSRELRGMGTVCKHP
jgi:hypothetical protein